MTAQPWRLSHRFDRRALPLADAHYNRQKIGSPQFVPPGRCLVLLTDRCDALWATSWPLAQFVRHAWPGAMVNSLFRRDHRCPDFAHECLPKASELIVAATRATRSRWPELPDLGIVSFVDSAKVEHKRQPGRCYLKAGWTRVKNTEGGLLTYQLLPADWPDALPARPRSNGQPDLLDLLAGVA